MYDPRVEALKAKVSLFGGGPASTSATGLGTASSLSSGIGGTGAGSGAAGTSRCGCGVELWGFELRGFRKRDWHVRGGGWRQRTDLGYRDDDAAVSVVARLAEGSILGRMATDAVLIEDKAVAEYLRTSYRPDCDFVDGSVEERNVGEFEHSPRGSSS